MGKTKAGATDDNATKRAKDRKKKMKDMLAATGMRIGKKKKKGN